MSHNIDLQQLTATNRSRAGTVHVLQPAQRKLYPFITSKSADGQTLNTLASQSATNHGIVSRHTFTPSTSLPSISQEATLDIRIPAGSINGVVRDVFIELDITNAGLNPAILNGQFAENLFRRVELLAESGSIILQRWTHEALMSSVLYDTPTELQHRLQLSATPLAGVAAGATQKCYVKLPWSVFNVGHVPLGLFRSDLFLRLVFRPDADSFSSFPEVCQLSKVAAHVEGIHYSSPINSALVQRARRTVQQYKFWSYQQMSETVSLNPSTTFELRLSSVTGLIGSFFVFIRPSGHKGVNSVNSEQLESYSLNDSSGRSILGASQFDRDTMIISKHQNNMLADTTTAAVSNLVQNVLYVPVSFADAKNVATGSLGGGYFPSDGELRFKGTTSASLVAGVFEVMFVYNRLDYMRSDGGKISVHSS